MFREVKHNHIRSYTKYLKQNQRDGHSLQCLSELCFSWSGWFSLNEAYYLCEVLWIIYVFFFAVCFLLERLSSIKVSMNRYYLSQFIGIATDNEAMH